MVPLKVDSAPSYASTWGSWILAFISIGYFSLSHTESFLPLVASRSFSSHLQNPQVLLALHCSSVFLLTFYPGAPIFMMTLQLTTGTFCYPSIIIFCNLAIHVHCPSITLAKLSLSFLTSNDLFLHPPHLSNPIIMPLTLWSSWISLFQVPCFLITSSCIYSSLPLNTLTPKII